MEKSRPATVRMTPPKNVHKLGAMGVQYSQESQGDVELGKKSRAIASRKRISRVIRDGAGSKRRVPLTLADTNRQYTTNAIQITGSRKAYNERMQSPMGSLR